MIATFPRRSRSISCSLYKPLFQAAPRCQNLHSQSNLSVTAQTLTFWKLFSLRQVQLATFSLKSGLFLASFLSDQQLGCWMQQQSDQDFPKTDCPLRLRNDLFMGDDSMYQRGQGSLLYVLMKSQNERKIPTVTYLSYRLE